MKPFVLGWGGATALASGALVLGACSSSVPADPPPLASLEQPYRLLPEPDDEAQRAALEPGAFSGVVVTDARRTLEDLTSEPEGVAVARIVENSPAVAAGLQVGDVLVEASVGGETRELHWPSDWRAVELGNPPGTAVDLVLERAGVEEDARLTLVERLRPAERVASERFVEDRRVGVVVRTPTEVEARAAGIPPGAGAVVVGLAQESPWRAAGVRYEDRIVAVDGHELGHPRALLDAIAAAPEDGKLALTLARPAAAGVLQRIEIDAPVSRRARETQHFSIPLVVSYAKESERTRFSAVLGLFRWERTPAAWSVRLLWLIHFGRGDSDRLREVDG